MSGSIGRVLLAVVASAIWPSACLGGGPEQVFGLKEPLRLIAPYLYEDGGTVPFLVVGADAETLRGGFDGRIQVAREGSPRHCYIGAIYPTDPAARLLPLWGTEERALVALLATLLRDSLSSDDIRRILLNARPIDIGDEFGPGIPHLARAVEGRLATHAAMDRGLPASPEGALRFFNCSRPLCTDSLILSATSNQFHLQIRDGTGQVFRVAFPALLDSLMGPSAASGPRFSALRFKAGSSEDRLLMTLTVIALEIGPEGRRPSVLAPASTGFEANRTLLLTLLDKRAETILEVDQHR